MTQAMVYWRKGRNILGKYIKGYLQPSRYRAPELPVVSIETTNICNAKCVYCANPIMLRKKEPLEMTSFKKVVDEFAAAGGTVIDFNATIGDPLLDPSLLERARYVKQYKQFESLGFVTTLEWLHKWDINEFFESGITWVSISITLSGRDKYLEFFGVDKYDITLKNLLTLIEENKKRGDKMSVYISLKPTDEPVEAILNHPDFKKVNSMTGQDLVADVQAWSYRVDDWLGTVKLPAYLKRRPLYPRYFRPCMILYKGLMIYSNGKIGACSCKDFEADSDLILGNVKDQPLMEIWQGEKLKKIRSDWLLKNKVPDICKTCTHYLY